MPTVEVTEIEFIILKKLRELVKEDKTGHIRVNWNDGNLDLEKNEKISLVRQTKIN